MRSERFEALAAQVIGYSLDRKESSSGRGGIPHPLAPFGEEQLANRRRHRDER